MTRALDLFAGPGGWDYAAEGLGLDPLGIEFDDAACATREAAGLRTVQADVAELDPADFGPVDLLIASPPCQAWSMAGNRLRRGHGRTPRRATDQGGRRPRAACDRQSAKLGAPYGVRQGAGNQPRSIDDPAPAVTTRLDLAEWTEERPSTAVCADPRISPPGYRGRAEDYDADGNYKGERSMDNAVRVTEQEAAILQGFPPDYPWQGSRTKRFQQIGNAVPPPLAAAILTELVGAELALREAA